MKKTDLKIGTPYAIGSTSKYDLDHADQGYWLGELPALYGGASRESVVIHRNRNHGAQVDAVEAQEAYESASVAQYQTRMRLANGARFNGPKQAEFREWLEANPDPKGWIVRAVPNSNILKRWDVYTVERAEREVAEQVRADASRLKVQTDRSAAEKVQKLLAAAGVTVNIGWSSPGIIETKHNVTLTYAQIETLLNR